MNPRRIQLSMNRLRSLSGDLSGAKSWRDFSVIRSIPVRRLLPEARRRRASACRPQKSAGRRRKSTGRQRRDSGRCWPSFGRWWKSSGRDRRESGRCRREPGRCRREPDRDRREPGRCQQVLFWCRRADPRRRPADSGGEWRNAGRGGSVYQPGGLRCGPGDPWFGLRPAGASVPRFC
jgi:hypothetical protein